LQPVADPRVHALMLMAPLSLKFGRHTLADVHVPVLLYSGDGDKLVASTKTPPPWRASCQRAGLQVAGRGRALCVHGAVQRREQIRAMPALCTDADGVDREDIHRNLISEAGRFSRARWAGRAGRGCRPRIDQIRSDAFSSSYRGCRRCQARAIGRFSAQRPALEQQGQPQPEHRQQRRTEENPRIPRFNATAPINGPAIASARSKNTA
jgi:hypothetical protein